MGDTDKNVWQPIGTAPKDGTKITTRKVFKNGDAETHKNTYYDNGWIYNLFGKIPYCYDPTHWKK